LNIKVISHSFLCLHLTVDPYLNKGLNAFQRLILFSQFLTIFGGIMFNWVESVDKLLEMEGTSSNSLERKIVTYLIVVINVAAIGIYPIWRMIKFASGFKGDLSSQFFCLRDYFKNCMRVKESHSNVKIFRKSEKLIEEARLRCPPEPISHSNPRGAPAPRPALLEPVYISAEMTSAAGPPSESLSAAATSGFAPTPPIRFSQISGDVVFEIGREESYDV
jgi:hypothetical protein